MKRSSLRLAQAHKSPNSSGFIVVYRILWYIKAVEHFKLQSAAVRKTTVSHNCSQISFTIYLEIFTVDFNNGTTRN